MSAIQENRNVYTDNTSKAHKVELRMRSLGYVKRGKIRVLDCFHGKGELWNEVKRRELREIQVLGLDKKPTDDGLKGNNVKFMNAMDINKYDIIDLDAYGVPFEQMEIVFSQKYQGIVHYTFIQAVVGELPKKMLFQCGFSESAYKDAKSVIFHYGWDIWRHYLSVNGVEKHVFMHAPGHKPGQNRKYYGFFALQ